MFKKMLSSQISIVLDKDNSVKVVLPENDFRTVLKVFFNNRYRFRVHVKKFQKQVILDRSKIEKNGSVHVKLFDRKNKLLGRSNLLIFNKKSSFNQTNLSISNYLSVYRPWKLYQFLIKDAVTIKLSAAPDFDLYANWENTHSWEFHAATSSGYEQLNIPQPHQEKILYVLVHRYSGSGAFTLQVNTTSANNTQEVTWSGQSKKMALISGISDYLNISDLSYCDEDATDWYNYLNSQGYECRVLGDNHPLNFPRYDGLATKDNIQRSIRSMVSTAKEGDTIAFITSGHGAGDGFGSSYLCTYGGNRYTDTELKLDLEPFSGNKIVIVDHCFSGGFADNLNLVPNLWFGATCSESGFGYDVAEYQNGAFTHAWHTVLENYPGETLTFLFQKLKEIYDSGSDKAIDVPMCVYTNSKIKF